MGVGKTIVALSSGKAKSAIAVIRLSGPDAFSILEACLPQGPGFGNLPAKTVGLFTFVNPTTRQEIDQITAVRYLGPNSFTGEDLVEVFCHGSEIGVEKILSCLVDCGAVYAERGEFTRRAYWNGKFDLVKAEAILSIIESKSEREYSSSVDAYFGGSRKNIQKWKKTITTVLRDVEAEIEFPGEVDTCKEGGTIRRKSIADIVKDIEKDMKRKQKAKIIEKGINIPIVGIPNAGKSSLFNLLLDCDRSIVHWEEGTTRDSISEEITIGTEKIRLIDTAGLRETESKVEQLGIGKTREYIVNSAMVLWVTPANKLLSTHEKAMVLETAKDRTICVISKEDQGAAREKITFLEKEKIPWTSACLLNETHREGLVSFIAEEIKQRTDSMDVPDVIRNKRQEDVARSLLENLRQAQTTIMNGEEVCALFLQKALEDISGLVGETTNEDILNSIFSEFCIGK